MTLEEAMQAAVDSGSRMVYQESKTWHHRGVLTEFTDADREAKDWQPLYSDGFTSLNGFRR